MPSSGFCEVYVYVADFSAIPTTSGTTEHYAEFVMSSVPQADSSSNLLADVRVIVPADENNYISLEIKIGTAVRVKIPTASFEKSFTVPNQDSYNLVELIE